MSDASKVTAEIELELDADGAKKEAKALEDAMARAFKKGEEAARQAAQAGDAVEKAFKQGQDAAKKQIAEQERLARAQRESTRGAVQAAQRLRQAGAEADRALSAQFKKLNKEAEDLDKKMRNKFTGAGLAMASIGIAAAEASRAIGAALKAVGEMAPDIDTINGSLSTTDDLLLSIKSAAEDGSLNIFEKVVAAGMMWAGNTNELNVLAAQAKRELEESRRQNSALMGLAADEVDASGAGRGVNLLGDFDKRDRERRGVARQAGMDDMERLNAAVRKHLEQEEADMLRINGRIAEHEQARREREWAALDEDLTVKQEHADREWEIRSNAAAERIKLAEEEARAQEAVYAQMANTVTGIVGAMADTAIDALFAVVEGQKVSGQQIVYEFLKSLGKQVFASGIANVLEGTARGFTSYGFDPTAVGLMKVGAAQMGIGGAMMAGAIGVGQDTEFLESQGGGSGGGAASSFRSGGASSGRDTNMSGGGSTYIINVNGVMTSRDAGREIVEAIRASGRGGLLE